MSNSGELGDKGKQFMTMYNRRLNVPFRLITFILAMVFTGSMGTAHLAQAEDKKFLGGELSANLSMLNDYRFRGVSLNDEGFALQGGFDWSHDSGFYVGTWASNISDFNGSTVETDFYAGYVTEVKGLTFDVGGMLYHYPGGTGTDYVELYGSVGFDVGLMSTIFGANYAFSNDNLGQQDNIYFFGDLETAIPGTPMTLNAHLGFEDGAFGNKKWDWAIGASVSYKRLDFGVSYIDTNLDGDNSDAAVIFSVGTSF